MKERGNTLKSLVIVIGTLAVVGFIGYTYLTRDASIDESSLLIVESPTASGVDGDLLKALQQLRTIKLDSAIFSDPSFRSFEDFGTRLTPQSPGRPNPFAPIGASSSGVLPASE